MTGLEIENWIEKRARTVRKFRSTRPRTESNFRFGLTSCRSQNRPTEVRSLLCQVFDSFSLVTSSSHHASHLRGFIRSLTRPNWSFHSTGLTMNFFYLGRRFSAGTWPSSANEWARGVGHGITSNRGLGRRSTPDLHSLTKNTSLEHKDRDFLQLDTRAAALGMQSYGRSYFCLLNVIFGCVSTEISIQFSTRFFPNRIEYSVC